MRSVLRITALVACIGFVAVPPAAAQSQWNAQIPGFAGLAEGGFLFTIAPSTFQGCSAGSVIAYLEGMPNLDLWSVVSVADEGAPSLSLHWVVTPKGAQNISWQADAWIRVFPLEPGDLEVYLADPCAFYGTHEFVAEGLGRWEYFSADDSLIGPGVNSWGFNLHANLVNNGYCQPGEDPKLAWIQKWVTKSRTDYTDAKSTALKGPTLICR